MLEDALAELDQGQQDEHDDANAADWDYDENDDDDENSIPKDLDAWDFASSDSEQECDAKNDDTKKDDGVAKAAKQRPEFIELKSLGLLDRPSGSTLGVHISACQWRGSYDGGKHHGRSWGTSRTPKKALLEVMVCILQEHVDGHPADKIAKGQLARVSKAWSQAD